VYKRREKIDILSNPLTAKRTQLSTH
jgi:hypothetical protein